MSDQLSFHQRMFGDDAVTSCLRARRELQRFLDGETAPDLAARVARHLDACRSCGLEARTYRGIKASLHTQTAPPPVNALHRLNEFAVTLTRQRD